jgi:hypothetical protein
MPTETYAKHKPDYFLLLSFLSFHLSPSSPSSPSLPYRVILLHTIIALVRFKYYFAWLLSEGSCVASGIGYNGIGTRLLIFINL